MGIDESQWEDSTALKAKAVLRLKLWKRRALAAVASFAVACFCLYLFLDGGPLHSYWAPTGQILVWVAFAGLIAVLYTGLLWWEAWRLFRAAHES